MGIITAVAVLEFYSTQNKKTIATDSPGRTRRLLVQGRKRMKKMRK